MKSITRFFYSVIVLFLFYGCGGEGYGGPTNNGYDDGPYPPYIETFDTAGLGWFNGLKNGDVIWFRNDHGALDSWDVEVAKDTVNNKERLAFSFSAREYRYKFSLYLYQNDADKLNLELLCGFSNYWATSTPVSFVMDISSEEKTYSTDYIEYNALGYRKSFWAMKDVFVANTNGGGWIDGLLHYIVLDRSAGILAFSFMQGRPTWRRIYGDYSNYPRIKNKPFKKQDPD